MKRIAFVVSLALLAAQGVALAQTSDVDQGKALWDKLQSQQLSCSALVSGDYALLGEYSMDLMMGSAHEAMDTVMAQRWGQDGLTQMHIVMGKRFSGCDTVATVPSSMMNGNGGMMGWGGMMGGYSSGWAWWLTFVLSWIFLGLCIVALLKWLLVPHGRK